MELAKFIENFADQFDNLGVETLSGNTVFKELNEWSSLTALSIIAMIDEEYDVNVGAKEIIGAATIEGLYSIVRSLK